MLIRKLVLHDWNESDFQQVQHKAINVNDHPDYVMDPIHGRKFGSDGKDIVNGVESG